MNLQSAVLFSSKHGLEKTSNHSIQILMRQLVWKILSELG